MNDCSLPLLPLVLACVPPSLRRALDQEGIACADYEPGAREGRFVLFDSRSGNRPSLAEGQTPIDIDPLRGICQQDPFSALADERCRRYGWQVGNLLVSEEIARVDKRAVRERMIDGLAAIIQAAGGVWLKLSPFPSPYRGAFGFRIDHDDYNAEDFAATLSAIEGHEAAVSHYVCASTHASRREAMARLAGMHVGSHGWWHHTYVDQADNYRNIARGIEALAAAGVAPVGFAAPHGRFNRGLLAALVRLEITHSSEFGLAYDDLPFFSGEGVLLQMPIHPVCLGICLDAARDSRPPVSEDSAAQTALAHLCRVGEEKHRAGQPVFLYGHPDGRLGKHPHVLRELLASMAGLDRIWGTSLLGFERWWRARAATRLRVEEIGSNLRVVVDRRGGDYPIQVEYCRGEHVVTVPLEKEVTVISTDAPAFGSRRPAAAPTVHRVAQRLGLRSAVRRRLDWERITPANEISTGTWRGWAKRTLRRMAS